MKTFASFALYVLSIVVAVGIGMFQVAGMEGYHVGSGDSECQQGENTSTCSEAACGDWSVCKSVEPGTGADSCTETKNASCYGSMLGCELLANRKSTTSLSYADCKTGG